MGFVPDRVGFGLTGRGEPVPKMVWRVKLVAELEPGLTTEVEIARLERDEHAGLADLGLRLAEAKHLTAALQAEVVLTQVTMVGRASPLVRGVWMHPGEQGSLYRDVPLPVRRCAAPGSAPARLGSVAEFGPGVAWCMLAGG